MSAIELTAYNGAILGPIAKLLGWIMNLVYVALSAVGIESVVLSIVLITIIIYMCMLPLTIQQQKFAKLQQAMQPELTKIQDKYKNKKDQASQQLMAEEQQLIYKKYGVNPMGSCAQLIIQMPILFALYRVFYNVPGYIGSVKNTFDTLATGVIGTEGYQATLENLMTTYKVTTGSGLTYTNVAEKLSGAEGTTLTNYVIDILYKLPSNCWKTLDTVFPKLASEIDGAWTHIQKFNYFLGMNISDTPWNIMKTHYTGDEKSYLLVFVALMIPVLAYLTQVLSIKLMPTASNSNAKNGQQDQMAQQMKTMNTMMPLMSLVICFTVPVGLGIYWIMSAVVRVIQMFFINKKMENLDLNAIIAENEEKAKKKREKEGIPENSIRNAAAIQTKKIEKKTAVNVSSENEDKLKAANEKKANAKAGSMAAKANMVKEFNERNSRK